MMKLGELKLDDGALHFESAIDSNNNFRLASSIHEHMGHAVFANIPRWHWETEKNERNVKEREFVK